MRRLRRSVGGTADRAPARYLRYDPPRRARAGLDHCRRNLCAVVREAFATGRLAVLPALRLHPKHNFGVDRDWNWDTYFDLATARVVDAAGGAHPLPLCRTLPERALRTLELPAQAAIPRAADDVELVVRETPGGFGRALPKTVKQAGLVVDVPPSNRVAELAAGVVAKLVRRGGYVAVHLRRGDRLRQEFEDVLSPAGVRRRLAALGVHDGERVFFLSDERDPAFWEELGPHYETVRSADFRQLAALVAPAAGRERDNYLLYAVERVVMASAWRRVETFWSYRAMFGHHDATLLGSYRRVSRSARARLSPRAGKRTRG